MKTEIINAAAQLDKAKEMASALLSAGSIIGFPTETVYGIGADIFNENAVGRIFEIKGREYSKPLSAHIYSLSQVELLCADIPEIFWMLAEKLLPGPLSIVLKANEELPAFVKGENGTISIRLPDSKIAMEIIRYYGQPLAGTSANYSGKNSAIDAQGVSEYFDGIIPLIIDGGKSRYSGESTIIDLTGEKLEIIRQGVLPADEILKFAEY